jgi:diacylglycerol O-acyltransferase / wax synthase
VPNRNFERLSAQDNSFLIAESSHSPLHVAAVGIYQADSLMVKGGGIDIRKIRRTLESRLHKIPRYRQKLMWVPVEKRAVWVDDAFFNIDYHLRHSALPHPGGLDELKKLTARITTRQLDRTRPLWEMWIVEGLSGNRFAMVSKIHHCMIDGASGADIAQILMSPTPEDAVEEPKPFYPRPPPSERELVVDAALHKAALPLRILQGLAELPQNPEELATEIKGKIDALAGLASWTLSTASSTPINGNLGPHRRIDWLSLPLSDVKAVRKKMGATVNDVILATVTGAVRQYMIHRGTNPDELDFRVSAPVSVRRASEQGKLGNRVSTWIVRLPVDQSNPTRWVEQIHAATTELKESKQADAFDMLMGVAEYLPSSLMAMGARAAEGPINMIVTNVQGPSFPLYLLGARLQELHPVVPLLNGTGLGIALFSYNGKIHVGLNADYELIPDLGVFTALFAQAFMALVDAAEKRTDSEVPAKKSAVAQKSVKPSKKRLSDAGSRVRKPGPKVQPIARSREAGA